MAHTVFPADELVEGDRIMVGVDILDVTRVTTGTVQSGDRAGSRWAFVYFLDGSALPFYTDSTWHTTVLNYSA